MSSSARVRLMTGTRNNNNPNESKPDGEERKLRPYDDAEYGRVDNLSLFIVFVEINV